MIGSISLHWSLDPHGRSVSSNGSVSKRSSLSLTNGPKWSHDCLPKPSARRIKLTGNWSRKNYMKKIWRRIRCFERLSSAESIGTASSTPTYTKDHGRSRKIGNCLSTCWNWKGPRSGQRLPSSWKEGLRMHWRIGSICSSIASARSLATLLRRDCWRFALIDWCLSKVSRKG